MKKICAVALILLTFLATLPINVGVAEEHRESFELMPCYTNTDGITASLSFSGNYAVCSGSITPLYANDVSVVVTLYQLVNDRWVYISSWSGNAKSGLTASAGGRAWVASSGTYKVTVVGNVDDLEYPAKSVAQTK